jgi:hypothetical protein
MRTLHWAERRCGPVRDSLIEAGTITRAKGRGGAVRRVHSAEAAAADEAGELRFTASPAVGADTGQANSFHVDCSPLA